MENLRLTIIVALCHFHRKIGPLVFYSYPEGKLDESLSIRIANIMDQTFTEGFFTHSFESLNSMNYYFEIHSDWARGNKEMLMISIIFEQQTNPEMEQIVSTLSREFSKKLSSNEKIHTAFYINEPNYSDEVDRASIMQNNSMIKTWVEKLHQDIIDRIKERTEEENIAYILNKKHIFFTLARLSKGPIALEELKEWFNEKFPDINFAEMRKTLEENRFIFINEIGRIQKYVLLLKEVNAERIPPGSVIEYIDDTPELFDLLLPKVLEYFSNYENKGEEELKEDSLTLFQLMSDPKIYKILSKLRDGLIPRDQLPIVSKGKLAKSIEIIDLLKKKEVIEELKYKNERYIVLKTNLQITTAFPEYLRKLLTKESKPIIANKYESGVVFQQKEMADILKDVRDKGEYKTKKAKINRFHEDLSSGGIKKETSKKTEDSTSNVNKESSEK